MVADADGARQVPVLVGELDELDVLAGNLDHPVTLVGLHRDALLVAAHDRPLDHLARLEVYRLRHRRRRRQTQHDRHREPFPRHVAPPLVICPAPLPAPCPGPCVGATPCKIAAIRCNDSVRAARPAQRPWRGHPARRGRAGRGRQAGVAGLDSVRETWHPVRSNARCAPEVRPGARSFAEAALHR